MGVPAWRGVFGPVWLLSRSSNNLHELSQLTMRMRDSEGPMGRTYLYLEIFGFYLGKIGHGFEIKAREFLFGGGSGGGGCLGLLGPRRLFFKLYL
jgi:hypothetical protein